MAERRGDEPSSTPDRRGSGMRTPIPDHPGDDSDRSRIYPIETDWTPGDDENTGTADDPGQVRSPIPGAPVV